MSKVSEKFWESVAGRELAATLHDTYWDAMTSLAAIEKVLQGAADGATD